MPEADWVSVNPGTFPVELMGQLPGIRDHDRAGELFETVRKTTIGRMVINVTGEKPVILDGRTEGAHMFVHARPGPLSMTSGGRLFELLNFGHY